nr:YraN family protein [uncultured Prevotella sp.]
MATHNDLGKWGEEMAVQHLREQGYTILDRDWRFGHRDLDIVARTPDGIVVVFVEVKTRTSDVVSSPHDAVDARKIKSLGAAANAYVKEFQIWDELRFDIISIIGDRSETALLEHVEDAFNPLLI